MRVLVQEHVTKATVLRQAMAPFTATAPKTFARQLLPSGIVRTSLRGHSGLLKRSPQVARSPPFLHAASRRLTVMADDDGFVGATLEGERVRRDRRELNSAGCGLAGRFLCRLLIAIRAETSIQFLCRLLPDALCLQPPPAFDAGAYSFFGDLSAADDALEGALEVRGRPKPAMTERVQSA